MWAFSRDARSFCPLTEQHSSVTENPVIWWSESRSWVSSSLHTRGTWTNLSELFSKNWLGSLCGGYLLLLFYNLLLLLSLRLYWYDIICTFNYRKGDVALLNCTAIVNTSNETLIDKNPISDSIHRHAGPELRDELLKLKGRGLCW